MRRITLVPALGLLLSLVSAADTVVLYSGASYNGHFMGDKDARISFQDNQGVQMQFPVHDIQSLSFTRDTDTVTLRNGKVYYGQLTGPENNVFPFVDRQGVSYQFPTNEIQSIVFSPDWGGP